MRPRVIRTIIYLEPTNHAWLKMLEQNRGVPISKTINNLLELKRRNKLN